MSALQLRFDPAARESSASSRASVGREARRLVVIQGRASPLLEGVLEGLLPGQIADQPIENDGVAYLIVKRVEFGEVHSPAEPRLDLSSSSTAERTRSP